MNRQSLVGHKFKGRAPAIAGRNSIATAFSSSIDHAFRERIFESDFGRIVDEKDDGISLYESGRDVPDSEFSGLPYPFEEKFHELLWKPESSFVVLEGREGVGKTTFLQFYFDHYLPNIRPTQELPKQAFCPDRNDIVLLYSNMRRHASLSHAQDSLFDSFYDQITGKFPSIATEKSYAMWDRKADWSSEFNRNAEIHADDINEYRRKYVENWFKDHETFVENAVWYLSRKREHGGRGLSVIVIVDNIDQQGMEVQDWCIRLLLAWFEVDTEKRRYGPLKVILPLRPYTMREMTPSLQPIEGLVQIDMPLADTKQICNRRGGRIEQEIRKSRVMVGKDFQRFDRVVVFDPLTPGRAGGEMKELITVSFQDTEDCVMGLATKATGPLICKLCNGSIRRKLRLRKRIACTEQLHRAMQAIRHGSKSKIPHYVFLDALLTAGAEWYKDTDGESDIINLYNVARTSDGPFAMLVGAYLLQLLERDRWTRDAVIQALERAGFSRSLIGDAIKAFLASSLMRFVGRVTREEIEVESAILSAHSDLLAEAAYTDNMAMVTPVEPEYLKNMDYTVSFRQDHLVRRVHTSISFLEQLRHDEEVVWNSKKGKDVSTKSVLTELGIEPIFAKVSFSYWRRLDELRKLQEEQRQTIRINWDGFLDNPIFDQIPKNEWRKDAEASESSRTKPPKQQTVEVHRNDEPAGTK